MRIAVSACLLGERCKYSGGSNWHEGLIAALAGHEVVPVCPEVLGGLPTPRPRCEIAHGRVVDEFGASVDEAFCRGAARAEELIAAAGGCDAAVLQPRSPSCGAGMVYDGTFSGTLVPGDGIFAARLRARGVPVYAPDAFCAAVAAAAPEGNGLDTKEEPPMAEEITNPVEAFDMHIAHIGINAADADDAKRIAGLFETLFGMAPTDTPVSVFADDLVEVMKGCGRGERGHIGLAVNDIPAAEAYFTGRGLTINEDSRALNPDGSTKLVYFNEEIAGFAFHLCV